MQTLRRHVTIPVTEQKTCKLLALTRGPQTRRTQSLCGLFAGNVADFLRHHGTLSLLRG
jgi:hypothetical protein